MTPKIYFYINTYIYIGRKKTFQTVFGARKSVKKKDIIDLINITVVENPRAIYPKIFICLGWVSKGAVNASGKKIKAGYFISTLCSKLSALTQ